MLQGKSSFIPSIRIQLTVSDSTFAQTALIQLNFDAMTARCSTTKSADVMRLRIRRVVKIGSSVNKLRSGQNKY